MNPTSNKIENNIEEYSGRSTGFLRKFYRHAGRAALGYISFGAGLTLEVYGNYGLGTALLLVGGAVGAISTGQCIEDSQSFIDAKTREIGWNTKRLSPSE